MNNSLSKLELENWFTCDGTQKIDLKNKTFTDDDHVGGTCPLSGCPETADKLVLSSVRDLRRVEKRSAQNRDLFFPRLNKNFSDTIKCLRFAVELSRKSSK